TSTIPTGFNTHLTSLKLQRCSINNFYILLQHLPMLKSFTFEETLEENEILISSSDQHLSLIELNFIIHYLSFKGLKNILLYKLPKLEKFTISTDGLSCVEKNFILLKHWYELLNDHRSLNKFQCDISVIFLVEYKYRMTIEEQEQQLNILVNNKYSIKCEYYNDSVCRRLYTE
ncbi:unnamed protein product, partial [Didymodactylos carnosus]